MGGATPPECLKILFFLLDGLSIVLKNFRDILQSFEKFYRMSKNFLENFQIFLKKLLKTHENFEKILITPEKLSKILKNFQKALKGPPPLLSGVSKEWLNGNL